VHQVPVRLVRPFVTAIRRAEEVAPVIIELRDSEGRSGWGEAPTSWRVTGESFASVQAVLEEALAPAVLGMPIDDPAAISLAAERAAVGNGAARMALDCAAYDLAAQQAEQPLWRYLGGRSGVVETDMTLSATTDSAALVNAARDHVCGGFTTLKVKVSGGTDAITQLAALREAVGAEPTLRVDANQAWSVAEAVGVIRRLHARGLDLQFVEQPTHRDDVRGLAEVAAQVPLPIMADESVWTRRHLRELLAVGRVGLINIKLAKTGGLREAVALAALAREHGLGIIVGCMLESTVGIAAAASLAATLTQDGVAHDLDGGLWLAESPVNGGAHYDGSRIVLSDAPGLGIAGLA
jgi:L-alanine-DL-glutamate epimerase-like enolase superfamily enzyme